MLNKQQPPCFTYLVYCRYKVHVSSLLSLVPSSQSEQSSEEEVRKRKVSKPLPRNVSGSESEDDEDSPSDSSQSESEDSESEAEVKKKKKVRRWQITRSLIHIIESRLKKHFIHLRNVMILYWTTSWCISMCRSHPLFRFTFFSSCLQTGGLSLGWFSLFKQSNKDRHADRAGMVQPNMDSFMFLLNVIWLVHTDNSAQSTR